MEKFEKQRAQHEAFAECLELLFAEYPASDDLRADIRGRALIIARQGLYRYCRVVPIPLLEIPEEELHAIHALIYG